MKKFENNCCNRCNPCYISTMTANNEAIRYTTSRDITENTAYLVDAIKAFAKASKCAGAFFDFGHGETQSFSRISKGVADAAYFAMSAIRSYGEVTLSRNYNRQVLVRVR